MAEKIVSPGVFTKEIDASFLPAAIGEIGAAVIGPAVKGPVLRPTVVDSYGDYQAMFGDVFRSSSADGSGEYYRYLTDHLAENYFRYGNKLTVVRPLAGSYTHATANVLTGSGVGNFTGSNAAGEIDTNSDEISFKLHTLGEGATLNNRPVNRTMAAQAIDAIDTTGVEAAGADCSFTINIPAANGGEGGAVTILLDESEASDPAEGTHTIAIAQAGTSDADKAADIIDAINGTTNDKVDFASGGRGQAGVKGITARAGSTSTKITLEMDTVLGTAGNISTAIATAAGVDVVDVADFTGGTNPTATSGLLTSGSSSNIRWEVVSANPKKGTFSLQFRSGNDVDGRKQVLETWNNLSLDPNANNYISRVIGDSVTTLNGSGTNDVYLQPTGNYPNKSKYVRVEVLKDTPDYLDENGDLRLNAASSSLPGIGSGSFGGSFTGGSDGTVVHPFGDGAYEKISAVANTQGLDLTAGETGNTAYLDSLELLRNQDEYDFNLLFLPGLINNLHTDLIARAINVCEDRGDCFVVVDPSPFKSAPSIAKTSAETRNTSFAGTYYPWVQIPDNLTGSPRWVPPSIAVSSVFAFNDKIGHPWFAPAGLNRGGLDNIIQTERVVTQSDRDDLYESNVNPITRFSGQGHVVYGQKTLQKKSSALDRINVRRLLIKVKKFIASSSRFLVFEQNNTATRAKFLNIVNPYLEQVQAQSGLNAFRVIMDDTNNTPDVVDRNILYGQLFLQPTKTAEFVILDFTVQPTGAQFSS